LTTGKHKMSTNRSTTPYLRAAPREFMLAIPHSKQLQSFDKADEKRIMESNRKSLDTTITRHKKLRALQKGFEEQKVQEEGETYGYGSF